MAGKQQQCAGGIKVPDSKGFVSDVTKDAPHGANRAHSSYSQRIEQNGDTLIAWFGIYVKTLERMLGMDV